MDIKNKNVVITGGTDGLGLSLVKLFLTKSAIVHVISKDPEKLNAMEKEINNNSLHVYTADVSDFNKVVKACSGIRGVDVLINNAGIWLEGLLDENKYEDISKVIDVNLKGPIYVTKALLPKLKSSPEAHIINVSSTSGLKGVAKQSVYVSSKMGLRGFTETLKDDFAGSNIKVSGFYPGGMKTRLFEKFGTLRDNQKWMNTDKIANIILFMVEQDDTMVIRDMVVTKRVK